MIKPIAPGVLLVCLFAILLASPAAADLRYVTRGKSNRIVIFLDALQSDPGKSFRWGDGVGSWPELMSGDLASDNSALPLAHYDTALLSFGGQEQDRASVPQLATRGLADLKAKGVIEGYESIIFIAHGAGGLVLKSMLVQSSIAGSASLAAKTKVAFLLSVPAEGRPAANFLANLAQNQGLAVSFGAIDVGIFLQGLDSLWSEYLSRRNETRRLEIFCRSETEPSFGLKVAAGQYTTEGCDDNGQEAGTDHTSIARPSSRDSGVYKWVRGHLADYFKRFPSDPGKVAPQVTVASREGTATAIPLSGAMAKAPERPPPAANAIAAAASPAPPANDLAPSAATSQSEGSQPAIADAVPGQMDHPGRQARLSPPAMTPRQPRGGDWTFSLKDANCNLNATLWVVQLHDRRLTSDAWDARVGADGRFVINSSSFCATEIVRGTVSGIFGSGWYLYADPCRDIYCRSKFKLTWRKPVPPPR